MSKSIIMACSPSSVCLYMCVCVCKAKTDCEFMCAGGGMGRATLVCIRAHATLFCTQVCISSAETENDEL